MPPFRNARRASIAARRCCSSTAAARWCCSPLPASVYHSIGGGVAGMANFKIYLLRQFCSNPVEFFFTIHRRQRRKKWWTRIFKFEFCDFWIFFWNFQKSVARATLRQIWTIMVAAKLDHSRVLVTKFHQNRSTLKGRSAGNRHTHRQTDRQARLKIRALQVCNRANCKGMN